MIRIIQEKVKKWLPLVVQEVGCDGAAIYFRGENWSFSAITSWRMIFENKVIFGSDDEDNDNEAISKIIKTSMIINIEAQSSDFAVDPVFCFDGGYRLEIFSDASYDTWTLQIPFEPLYDFNSIDANMEIKKSRLFLEIRKLLPLTVAEIVHQPGCLTLSAADWSLTVPSSWRLVKDDNEIFGQTEQGGRDIIRIMKDIEIIEIQPQSSHCPIDPILFFSNGYRLELFTASTHTAWEFQLPSGQMIVGGVQS